MQHYKVHLIDSITNESMYIHFFGKLDTITVMGKEYDAIVNEFGIPKFIFTYNIISIEPV